MPVLVGTPSVVLVSRVQVYQTCSVDLSWQHSIHSCQRCPRAVMTTNTVALAPVAQPSVERAISRFCPAGVHMSNCIPATEMFPTIGKSATSGVSISSVTNAQPTPNGINSTTTYLSWGPPNLPSPAASPNHPVHAANLARASYSPAPSVIPVVPVSVGTTTTGKPTPTTTVTTSSTVHHFHPTLRSKSLSKIEPVEKVVDTKDVDAVTTLMKTPTTTKPTIVSHADGGPTKTISVTTTSIPITSAAETTTILKSSTPPIITTSLTPTSTSSPTVINNVSPIPNEIKNGTKELMVDSTRKVSELKDSTHTQDSKDASTKLSNDANNELTKITTIGPKLDKILIERENKLDGEARVTEDVPSAKAKKDEIIVRPKNTSVSDALNSATTPSRPSINSEVVNHEDGADKSRVGLITIRPGDRTGAKQQTCVATTTTTTPITSTPASFATSDSSKSELNTTQTRSQAMVVADVTPSHDADKQRLNSQKSKNLASAIGIGDVGSNVNKLAGTNRTANVIRQTSTESKQQLTIPVIPHKTNRRPLPAFHFPLGTTRLTDEEISAEMDRIKRALNKLSESTQLPSGKNVESLLQYSSFGNVAKALNCPLYWKYIIYMSSGGTQDKQAISVANVLKTWNHVLTSCPDDASRFVYLLTKGRATHLVQADFDPLIQDILESHPGLAFLEAAKDFHSRYVTTVVARIFFNVNSSWSGRISLGELRRSNFLSVLASLEEQEDINLVTQYFSYEHFYVIYCKFWELDEDHDLIISRADLARHNNYAISDRMIDRIFSGAVTRGTSFKEGVMAYADFVWFLLAEEDKRHPRSIEYWFRCMDLDGDGLLSMYELEFFYSEQLARMEEMGIEPISFEDCLCQCLDMVKPALGDKIRLSDMKQCRLCHIFFDTFFNLPKYLQHEQRDPFANLRDIEEGLNEFSDWDRYAAEAYEMLVAVEGGNQEDGVDDEDGDEEEEELDDADLTNATTVAANSAGVVNNTKSEKSTRNTNGGVTCTSPAGKQDPMSVELANLESPVGVGENPDLTKHADNGRKVRRK